MRCPVIPSQLQSKPRSYNSSVNLTIHLSWKRGLRRFAADAAAAFFCNIAVVEGGDCVVGLARHAAIVDQSVLMDRVATLCYGGGYEEGGDAEKDGLQMHIIFYEVQCRGVEIKTGILFNKLSFYWKAAEARATARLDIAQLTRGSKYTSSAGLTGVRLSVVGNRKASSSHGGGNKYGSDKKSSFEMHGSRLMGVLWGFQRFSWRPTIKQDTAKNSSKAVANFQSERSSL
ncbi:hypothetical protein V501_02780 [Pseudogymnoascus sp. VKM F-4519 (FW-2642)]|nr:hypothetical protein V501_02780 [Pseudogymnoascus sp. VKM F-4519 (FW-2642)]